MPVGEVLEDLEDLVDFETLTHDFELGESSAPCEHSLHTSDPKTHEGDGKYLVRVRCPEVEKRIHRVFCQKFVSLWTTHRIRCSTCHSLHLPSEVYEIIGVKGVDF